MIPNIKTLIFYNSQHQALKAEVLNHAMSFHSVEIENVDNL